MIAAWPMVSMAQPSQPRLRNDPDNVRQVLPSRPRTTLDGYQAVTGRHAQGELRQLPADTGAECRLAYAIEPAGRQGVPSPLHRRPIRATLRSPRYLAQTTMSASQVLAVIGRVILEGEQNEKS